MNESEVTYSLILELQYQKLVTEGKLAEAQARLDEATATIDELRARIDELEGAPRPARSTGEGNGVVRPAPVAETT